MLHFEVLIKGFHLAWTGCLPVRTNSLPAPRNSLFVQNGFPFVPLSCRQPVVRLYGRTLSAFRTEKILVLYFSGSQYAVFFEKFRIENAVLHRKGQDAVNVLGTLLVETGGEVFVEKVVGVDVVTLTGIDIRQCAYQDGESTVSFALHDTAHNAVVYEVCTHGEVVQSPFFDSCHVLVCGQI